DLHQEPGTPKPGAHGDGQCHTDPPQPDAKAVPEDEVTGERARPRDVVASSPDLEDLQRANQGVGARNGAQIGQSTPGDARGQERERDELQGADEPLRPIVVSIEACRVEDLADPGPPRRYEQQRRLTDAPPARMGHDELADLPDDDHEGQVIKQFEPRRRAMSPLARADLRTPRPASMGTTARPRHQAITVIVLVQLDDPLTWPDASAGYFPGSVSLRSDQAARSLTKLRSARPQDQARSAAPQPSGEQCLPTIRTSLASITSLC